MGYRAQGGFISWQIVGCTCLLGILLPHSLTAASPSGSSATTLQQPESISTLKPIRSDLPARREVSDLKRLPAAGATAEGPRREDGPIGRSADGDQEEDQPDPEEGDTEEGDADEEDDDDDADAEDKEEDSAEEEVPLTLLPARWHTWGPITAEYLYTGEVFNNAHGGVRTQGATEYRGNLDVILRLDSQRAGWWQGGEFFLYMQQSHGRTLTPRFVGDGQLYSNIDTGLDQDVTQLAEYWYEHTWGEDIFKVKLGRQDANEDFAFSDLAGDFINASFITLANVPLPTWPFQTLGVSTLWQPNQRWRFGGGVFDHGRNRGQWWVNTTSRGTFFIGQADWLPFIDMEDALLTQFRFGSWYVTSDTVAVDESVVFEDNHGFYVTVDQMLFTEKEDAEQGLGAFFHFSWAPQDRNQVVHNYAAGLVYRGLIDGRNEDTVGAAFTLIQMSPLLEPISGQTSENAIEVFYKARLRDWFTLQPDIQSIIRPNGLEKDALVVGVRCEIFF